jgi:hypothetical protein
MVLNLWTAWAVLAVASSVLVGTPPLARKTPIKFEATHRDKTGTACTENGTENQNPWEKTRIRNITDFLAERGGFEPPVSFRIHRFSKPAQSAALSPLRNPLTA